MNIPTEEQCLKFHKEYLMLDGVSRHSLKVRNLAVFIAKKLNEQNFNFNLQLIESAALLHDITKTHQVVIEAFEQNNIDYTLNINNSSIKDLIKIKKQWGAIKEKFQLTSLHHPISGAGLVRALGFEEVASIIEQHGKPITKINEAGIICYADRKVNGEIVVSLEERFDYMEERYGKGIVDELKESTLELEQKIFKAAGIAESDLLFV
ncbi:MAG: HD domain-containing protein [Nanoarchaeota archaeon]|nr:HD domain-containing protein [Nanoarchaeota archaeon]